ncbi:hypothetical protein [Paenibacillus sp. 481]|uniref:hypothetical protein n=1 Tax=Paenibacillus sp. 481 TaxID=2835869 RepID=UPI001E39276F|nr:hypothetical protein [Paenibacillus sp. 481]UHA71770.1 hypothetical protein KIK04_13410 [Paenibacillus sp. 481]
MITLKKHELKGHDVFEIMRGKLKEAHWLESSIFITDECFENTELGDVLTELLDHFNYYGPTEVNRSDWENIKKTVYCSSSEITKQLVSEIDEWAEECFELEPCFTICGV